MQSVQCWSVRREGLIFEPSFSTSLAHKNKLIMPGLVGVGIETFKFKYENMYEI